MKTSKLPDKLGSVVRLACEDYPNSSLFNIDGKATTRNQFLKSVQEKSGQLKNLGLHPGGRVIVKGGRGAEFFVDMAAVWLCDAVVVPMDPSQEENQVTDITRRVKPTFIMDEEVQFIKENQEIVSKDVAAILFTSGSTGQSKGVVLSHGSLLGNSSSVLKILPLRDQDRLGVAVPFHFTSAICHFLACLISGAEFVGTERKLMPIELIDFINGRCTCFGGAPIQLDWIQAAASTHKLDLRWVMSSGDYLPKKTILNLRENLPSCGVYTFYGLTEVGGRFCVLPDNRVGEAAGTVGKPIDGLSFEIRKENGELCLPGEAGEVWVTGDYLLEEYFEAPEITAASIQSGFFRTGDMGFTTPLGDLSLVGRADDVFKVGGQKVSAISIESQLSQGAFFQDVAVVPIMQPDGLKPFVFFVPKDAGFEKGEVMRFLRQKLPSTHMPHKFVEVREIPRSGAGKVRRSELRELVTGD